jgi:hypothetical protein
MTDFETLVRRLSDGEVQYIVVGGFAGTVLGSPRITIDLDIVYARDTDNLERLVRALAPLSPYLRGAPKGLPFHLDVPTCSGV